MASERFSPLSTPSATREVLERHGLYTKYALGQNFLVSDDVIGKIIALADVQPTDCILEVGPGIGTLTAALLPRVAHVTAIEKDHDLPPVLADTLAPWADKFTLIQADALELPTTAPPDAAAPGASPDSAALPSSRAEAQSAVVEGSPRSGQPAPTPNKLVANLPYAIAATVTLDYQQRLDFLTSATIMVQKEVADRMTAHPGTKAYGAYTVKLSLYARPAGRFQVAPGNFFPPPRVESSVLRLDRDPARDDAGRALTAAELEATCEMADAAFATRRKTLANSCKTHFAARPDIQAALPRIFETAAIDPRRRGETLTRDEFIRLGKSLQALQGDAPLFVGGDFIAPLPRVGGPMKSAPTH